MCFTSKGAQAYKNVLTMKISRFMAFVNSEQIMACFVDSHIWFLQAYAVHTLAQNS